MPIESEIINKGEKGGKMSEQEERNLINIEEDIYILEDLGAMHPSV